MKIKRYHAADMRQAIRKVREELGPDAVILSNTRVNGGTEIVAAVDYDESLLGGSADVSGPDLTLSADRDEAIKDLRFSRNIPGGHDRRQTDRRHTDRRQTERRQQEHHTTTQTRASVNTSVNTGATASANVWSQEPTLVTMQNELKTLRSLLVDQLSGLAWNDAARQYPMRTRMLKRLIAMGISPAMARKMVERVDENADIDHNWRSLLGVLAHQVSVTGDDILTAGGRVALIGPTGVGKTTTIAKLAARYTLRHGRGRVALVSTDCYRIAGHEQLRTFARILEVPMYVAKDTTSLHNVLTSLQDKELVLIDTAGMSQRDMRLCEQFTLFQNKAERIRTYLVLAANTQRAVLEEVIENCSSAEPAACIVTKVDETTSLGGVLSASIENQLPLAYLSDGQRVPEDLHIARGHSLVSRGVAIMQQTGARQKDEATNLTVGGMVANAHG
jgi:flagellar biosynthesis protein FlhF